MMPAPADFAEAVAANSQRAQLEADIADLKKRIRRLKAFVGDLQMQLDAAEDRLAKMEETSNG